MCCILHRLLHNANGNIRRLQYIGRLFPFRFIDKAGGWNEFYIDLDTLTGIFHLLIRLWNVFGVGKLLTHDSLFLRETIQTGNGTFIATLHEFPPKDDRTGMRIASTHIMDKLDFFWGMPVGMVIRAA